MVMHLKSCCCGCSLKTGSIIIGVLSGLNSLGGLLVSILMISLSGELKKELTRQVENNKDTMSPEDYENAMNQIEAFYGNKILSIFFICCATISALNLFFDIMMVFGASAERPRLIKPWIVYVITLSVIAYIGLFVYIIFLFVNGAIIPGVLCLVMAPVGMALTIYLILVVNSYHTELLSHNFQNKV